VRQLGAADFGRREQAQAKLRRMGPAVRADLEACWHLAADPEMRSRLRLLLGPRAEDGPAAAAPEAPFDRLQLGELLWGSLGDEGVAVRIDGATYRLTRKDVRAISDSPPREPAHPGGSVPARFQRISEKDFPPGCVEEAFERTPEGRPLQIGENIEKLFVSKGFLLSTSITTSYVSVNNFVVEGKSRGLSAATHNPLWQGEITVTFVQPGHADVPAGVSHFGCYIASVLPRGTTLIAFDRYGKELGRIDTQRHNTDFLGVRSAIPIHRVRIVPNVEIDRDYTLDDFIFLPVPDVDAAHPSRYTVRTAAGDRVLCADVSFGPDGVRLHGLLAGLPDLCFRASEVRRVSAPRPGPAAAARRPAGVFAELRDGSIVFGSEPTDGRGAPVFTRRPRALQERPNLAGVWSDSYPRLPRVPKGAAVVWSEDEKRWREISYVRFLEEVVLWKAGGEHFEASGYRKLPPLWLAAPVAGPAPGSWHVRTIQGEDLVLAGAETIDGRLSREVRALWQGQPLRIPGAEVVAIYQVDRAR
jgi:hypothetical protein